MNLSQDPSASEPVPNSPNPNRLFIEPEPYRERDNIYYFDNIVFQVENTLFRVPKNGFQVAGSFFETIFSLPQPEGEMVEGSDDICPLPLLGINKAHFRSFLRVLYPFDGTAKTSEEWVGALDLATMWDFRKIRKASVRALSNIIVSRDVVVLRDIVELILLAKKYRVKQWLQDGYFKLIQQPGPLKIDELLSLNLDLVTIARIYSIREAFPNWRWGITVDLVDAEVNRIFSDEIKEMEDFEGIRVLPRFNVESNKATSLDWPRKKRKL
jgi:hypothetical protein